MQERLSVMRDRRGMIQSKGKTLSSKDNKDSKKKRNISSIRLIFAGTAVATMCVSLFAIIKDLQYGTEQGLKAQTEVANVSLLKKPPKCSAEQIGRIQEQLPDLPCIRLKGRPWSQGCSFTVATSCPKQTWVEEFYAKQATDAPFVGISVGCNKAFDAIETMRMGSSNAKFDKVTWGKTMTDDGVDLDVSVCRQNSIEQVGVDSSQIRLESEMHCIEPMPLTYEVLQRTANKLDLEKHGFTVKNAAIGKTSGTVLFPKAAVGSQNHNRVKVGTENKGMDSCYSRKIAIEDQKVICQQVSVFSLDDYVSKYVKSEGPIHMLSIDVEGYDFDVMLGGREALKRTHYVEFEYNWMGPWKDQHLEDAIKVLDEEGFTCYWAGRNRLWRITDCWQEYYDIHHWSNVACVNRSQYTLAKDMEDLFLKTLQKKEVYVKGSQFEIK